MDTTEDDENLQEQWNQFFSEFKNLMLEEEEEESN